jgi:PhzF family phenazine biosynthesis protein
MKTLILDQVDAFTARPFSGNPAGVCLLDQPRSPTWMQSVAAEMNLSETAFLLPGTGSWVLRWFTPKVEVALCGHATLASAHVLWERGLLGAAPTAHFDTHSGRLSAAREGDLIVLDFPADPVTEAVPPPGLIEALGVKPKWIGRGKFDYLVEVEHEDQVSAAQPDFARLAQVESRGTIITAPASGETEAVDFVSRFFAPRAGVLEDPVTGSAHCSLTCFWHERTGKTRMNAVQLSQRGGRIRVELVGDRVKLGGHAVTVIRGELVFLEPS